MFYSKTRTKRHHNTVQNLLEGTRIPRGIGL